MIIEEVQKDLFTVPQGYYLAHCISADFSLGVGIAHQFDKVYNMKFKLIQERDFFESIGAGKVGSVGTALLIDNVFNLVTKNKYWKMPTYGTLTAALMDMQGIMEDKNITKLAIPKIGSGLDRLDWDTVFEIIVKVFEETNVEILICEL